MALIDTLLNYWLAAPWPIALAIAFIANTSAYLLSAYAIDQLSAALTARGLIEWLDNRALKPRQKQQEMKHGIVACAIFATLSLLTREVYTSVWPNSLTELILQVITFVIFYETYSYFIHRLLHTKRLIEIHAVHHRSVRTTPWSAYSVHPIEAALIGITAPLFMYLIPMSIGVAFVLHFSGMMFTIFLHGNISLRGVNRPIKLVNNAPLDHSKHHQVGNKNFGFVNALWDNLMQTNYPHRK